MVIIDAITTTDLGDHDMTDTGFVADLGAACAVVGTGVTETVMIAVGLIRI